MFCENCGAPISENEKFCRNCGSPVLSEEITLVKKKSRKGLVIGLCAAVLVIGGAGTLAAVHFLSGDAQKIAAETEKSEDGENDVKADTSPEKEEIDKNEKPDVTPSEDAQTSDFEVSGGDAFEEAIHQTSFWGVWCKASEKYEDVKQKADELIEDGYYAQVVSTSDWTNLNQKDWYAVTAGMYATEAEARDALVQIQKIYGDAYIKYSGEYVGFKMDSTTDIQADSREESYSAESTYEKYPICQVVHCNEFITLRETPNTSGKEICKMPLGVDVSFIENSDNGFAKVAYGGHQGYCLVSYLNFYNYSDGTAMTVYNCNESITLRKIPSTKGEEICQIPLGRTVVFRAVASNGFYLISYNGYTGYSLAQYLTE